MKKVLIFLVLGVAVAFANNLKVKSSTEIYAAQAGDASKGELSKGTMLFLVKKGANRTFVKTDNGVKGWVNNGDVEFVKGNDKGDQYNLDEMEVSGWLDNPSAVYILDNSGLGTDALPISRSFEDEIFEKQDREEIERSNDEN